MSNGRRRNITHTIAFCQTCGWQEEDYLTAASKGRYHAKSKRHNVTVEVAYFVEYNERKEPTRK